MSYLNYYYKFLIALISFEIFPVSECRGINESSNTSGLKNKTLQVKVAGKLFSILFLKKSWVQAVAECGTRDSELAEINSIPEARALARAMFKHRPAIESAWIAGYFNESTDGMSWRWLSTGKKIELNDFTDAHDKNGVHVFLSSYRKNKLTSDDFKNICIFFDCHIDQVAIMESLCQRRRQIICQNKYNFSQEFNNNIRENFSSSIVNKFLNNNNNKIFTTAPVSVNKPSNYSFLLSDSILSPTTTGTSTSTSFLITPHFLPPSLSLTSTSTRSSLEISDLTEPRMKSVPTIKATNLFTEKTQQLEQKKVTQKNTSTSNYKNMNTGSNYRKYLNSGNESAYSNLLKLYYAFEGPLVGKLDDSNSSDKKVNTYKKYMKKT